MYIILAASKRRSLDIRYRKRHLKLSASEVDDEEGSVV